MSLLLFKHGLPTLLRRHARVKQFILLVLLLLLLVVVVLLLLLRLLLRLLLSLLLSVVVVWLRYGCGMVVIWLW